MGLDSHPRGSRGALVGSDCSLLLARGIDTEISKRCW